MPITEEDVDKIATLAHLALSEEEKTAFTSQLGAIVSYIDKLSELDVSNVEPMSHCTVSESGPGYTARNDEVRPSLGQEAVLSNAPDQESGFFLVPKVI